VLASDLEVGEILPTLPLTKIESYFFRMVSVRWMKDLYSAEGARLRGGRYNPPPAIAEALHGIAGGFGFLYTTTNPVTCLFECKHILRGVGEMQALPIEPSVLVTIEAECDRVLDLRDDSNCRALGLAVQELSALDNRFRPNRAGRPTDLQRLGAAIYKSGRFAGLLAPSR
jgi:RES domain-containing protein